MREVDERYADRHESLHLTFIEHAAMVTSRIDPDASLSDARELLLGASFTHEYSIEGAALCNPSAVLHPQQDTSGDAAFILSVRGIGEGHRSSIGFRTGTVTGAGTVTIDRPGPFPRLGVATPGPHHRAAFHAKLSELGDDHENAAYVLDALPARFDDIDLATRIKRLAGDVATRRNTATTIANLRDIARSSYCVEFPNDTDISEQVLWPQAPAESHGMEDARFVRFTDNRGEVRYYATYTAFDGIHVSQQLLETTDFATFSVSPIGGAAATGKGLALFPRQIRGRYVALSRSDRDTIAFSDDLRSWDRSETIQIPEQTWEILQLGNCGSPIETDAGWLVITHGVGPMRTYSLGAILLDIDEPQRVIARSVGPILSPDKDLQGGYVPNVVYSCGSFAHNDILILPYGVGDQTISIATFSVDELVRSLRPEP
jgi:predicted GH43/DUF377 family glycosyl hydrolase